MRQLLHNEVGHVAYTVDPFHVRCDGIMQELCRIPSIPMHPTHTFIKYLCAICNEKYKGQFDFYVHYDCT